MADDRRPSEGSERGGDRRFFAKPKFCQFCADKTLTEEGNIRPRRQTGACAKHQRVVAQAVKQARHIALVPFTGKQMEETR
jgi:small subunit ribosomal protein S18